MRILIPALVGTTLCCIPAFAGFPRNGKPTMTKDEILKAFASPNMTFKEEGRIFKILPVEGFSQPLASGDVLDSHATTPIKGRKYTTKASQWLFMEYGRGPEMDPSGSIIRDAQLGIIAFIVKQLK